MNYTPGPWAISRLATPDYAPEFSIYAESSQRDLARVVGDNSLADATLMAAAPKLLHAIQSCHRFLRKAGYDMVVINAAIAEALGDQS